MGKPPLVIDTDPGIDDSLAIMYLTGSACWDLKAITAVAGNVPLERGYANARGLAALLHLEDQVPVYAGCSQPLLGGLVTADSVHGQSGIGRSSLPQPSRPPEREHAVQAILRLSHDYAGELTILAIGPLTNVATALSLDPGLAGRVKRLVIMGGAVNSRGNMTPAAEFNIYVDPEAASRVFASGLPCTLVGLDVTRQTRVNLQQLERLGDSAVAGLIRELVSFSLESSEGNARGGGMALHDPLAAGVATDPSWVTLEAGRIEVETAGQLTRGETLFWPADSAPGGAARGAEANDRQTYAATAVDHAFIEHFVDTLARL